MHQLQQNIITECLDLLAGFELLTDTEKSQTAQTIIDTLGSYPKPQKKNAPENAPSYLVGAYLMASNVRNACKLFLLGYLDDVLLFQAIAQENCENALGLLTNG